ncbi:MAG: ester cyclase [Streptosporangiaceae bacterium]
MTPNHVSPDQIGTEQIGTEQATMAANIALMRSLLDAFNAGDFGTCVARLRPDFVMNMAGLPPMPGPEVWRQGADLFRRAFPDMHVQIDDVVAAGDQVALRLTFRGTHLGDYLGLPATGRAISYVSHEFYRIADGLIAEEWICSDTATMQGQLTGGGA